jgi:hypothetical protein
MFAFKWLLVIARKIDPVTIRTSEQYTATDSVYNLMMSDEGKQYEFLRIGRSHTLIPFSLGCALLQLGSNMKISRYR